MKNLILFLSVLLVLASCGDKNAQTKDSATSDTTAAKQTPSQESEAIAEEDDYDLEAIAKVIEGCEDLGSFSHGLAGVKKDDKVGYIDKKGRTVIPFEYDGPIQDFFDGIVTVFKGDDNIYMDPTGKELFRTQRFGRFNDGLSQERSENGLIGFKDKTGKVVIPAQFDYAGEFSDGMCWVTKPGSDDIGYIDTTGKLVVPCLYAWPPERSPTDFHEGLCCVMVDADHERFAFIDKTGKRAFPAFYNNEANFHEGLAYVWEVIPGNENESKQGYIDKTGKMVLQLEDECWGRDFCDGLAIVIKHGKPLYAIDKTGKKVFDIDPQYQSVEQYGDGAWLVWNGEKMGYIDQTGKTIVPCQYYAYKPFSEGLVALQDKQQGRWGFADKKGHTTFDF